jgi:hypothetical protein
MGYGLFCISSEAEAACSDEAPPPFTIAVVRRWAVLGLAVFAACGGVSDGDAIGIGPDTFGGTVVADGRLAAGFEAPLEENAERGEKPHRSLETLCIFRLENHQTYGGGCGGFTHSAYIGDEGCNDTEVFGILPRGGRAVVKFMDGRVQAAQVFASPPQLRLSRSFFYLSRSGVHTVKRVSVYSASGERVWTQAEGPDDVSVECG